MTGVLFLLGCAGFLVIAVVRRSSDRDAARTSDPRTILLTRWRSAGIALGVLLAAGAMAMGNLGRGPLLASVAFGLGVLAGILAGELLLRPDQGTQRHASVQPRTINGYRPRTLGRVVTAATAILVVVMVATTAGGSADDQQRAGRSLAYTPDPTRSASHGPWPGSYYTIPAAVALSVAAVVTALVLIIVVRRPANGDRVVDNEHRRRSAEAVTAAWGIAIGIPLVGFCLTAASALIGIGLAPMWWRVAGWTMLALAACSLVLVLWCLSTLFGPSRRAAAVIA